MSFSLFALFFGAGCKKNEIYPSTVNAVLKQAKGNSVELKKALDYFLAQRDTLKIKAIFFLVENMRDKYSIIPEGANDPFQKTILSNWSETEAWEPSKSRIGMAFDSILPNNRCAPEDKNNQRHQCDYRRLSDSECRKSFRAVGICQAVRAMLF